MTLLERAIAHFEGVQRALNLSPILRRVGATCFILFVGCLQYYSSPQFAKTPFYLLPLIPIAFLEPLPVATAFSLLASAVSLGADLLSDPACVTLVFPYWSALARLIGFGFITTAISLAVAENRRLSRSELALQDKARELAEKNRALEESLRQLRILQEALVDKEKQAAVAEALQTATYDIERPLMSMSVFSEELLRLSEPDEHIHPLAEKISEGVENMERIMESVRETRKKKEG